MTNERKYPIRVRFEGIGYNYIKGFGQLLFDGILFKEATFFNDEGYAEVVTDSGERKRIDKNGNFC